MKNLIYVLLLVAQSTTMAQRVVVCGPSRVDIRQSAQSNFPINKDFVGTFYDPSRGVQISFALNGNQYSGVFTNLAGQKWQLVGTLINSYTISGADGNGVYKASIYGNTLIFLSNADDKFILYRQGSVDLNNASATYNQQQVKQQSQKQMCTICMGVGSLRCTDWSCNGGTKREQYTEYYDVGGQSKQRTAARYVTCPLCSGRGKKTCFACSGTGQR